MTRGGRPHLLLLALALACSGPKYIATDEGVCRTDRECTDPNLCLARACVPRLDVNKIEWAVEIVPGPPPSPADGGMPAPAAALTQQQAVSFGRDAVPFTAAAAKTLMVSFQPGNTATQLPENGAVILTVRPGIPGQPDLVFTADTQPRWATATLSIPDPPAGHDKDEFAGRPGTLQLVPRSDDGIAHPYLFPVTIPTGDMLAQTIGSSQSVRGTLQSALSGNDVGFDPTKFVGRAFQGGTLISNSAIPDGSGRYVLQVPASATAAPVTIAFAPTGNSTTRSDPWFVSNDVTLPVASFDVTLPYIRPPDLFALPIEADGGPIGDVPVHATSALVPSPLGQTTYSWRALTGADGLAPLALLSGTPTDPRRYTFTITPPVGSPFATTCETVDLNVGGSKAPTPPVLLPKVTLPRRAVVTGTVSSSTGRKLYNVVITATMLVPADPTCEPGYRTTSTATDLEGRFTMALDPGRYRFDYDPPPGAPVPRKTALDVSLSADVVHEVRLDQAAYVQGQVYAPNNKALAMAIVRLYKVRCRSDSDCFGPSRTAPLLIAQARTDATGKFVAVVPGPCGEPGKSTCDGDGGSE